MSDVKLFRLDGSSVGELTGRSLGLEKPLQEMLERSLDVFLGVRFLASEYATGKTHGGRIDTLGIDENNCPVIIEYKRSTNENVINQGLFYLDWLLDHQAEFTLLAMKVLGPGIEESIDWSGPRLLCIAGNFTRYDEHAVSQINRNIELLRYRHYTEGYLMLELVNATSTTAAGAGAGSTQPPKVGPVKDVSTVSDYLAKAPTSLRALFEELESFALALGDDVTKKILKHYIAFRRIRNFATAEIHPTSRHLLVYLRLDPDNVDLDPGFSRDMRGIGHFGTGDLELRITDHPSLERALRLVEAAYEGS